MPLNGSLVPSLEPIIRLCMPQEAGYHAVHAAATGRHRSAWPDSITMPAAKMSELPDDRHCSDRVIWRCRLN